MFQKIPNVALALLSGILFSAGWFSPFTLLIFISWVPLLIIEERISTTLDLSRKKIKVIGLSYLAFFVWNICVTWWIYHASLEGAILAIVCNPIFMCMTFMIWHNLKRRIKKPWAVWLLIPIWLAYEYGHTLWDLTWSWLVLGNAFAFNHNLVQWYEFTGTSGGSLWVLIVNILCFDILKNNRFNWKRVLKPVTAIVLPIFASFAILKFSSPFSDSSKSYKTLVVQPNVDPYNDKFYFEPEVQLHNLLIQLTGKLDSSFHFLVLPETYLTEEIIEGQEKKSYSLRFLNDSILAHYPNLTIITGATTFYVYPPHEQPSATARQDHQSASYYDIFNTAIQLNASGISYYHKSKLVPGVERMPFPALFKPLESFAINLGGTMGSLGTQQKRDVFWSHQNQVGVAPVICYESAYSDYTGGYIRNGANLIFIITNDGWWSDSPGHKQHLAYARLRAIETRREITRCANTGISCFVTAFGEIEQATPYWEEAIIQKNITPNNARTFFVKFGDLISYASAVLAILLLGWSQILRFRKS